MSTIPASVIELLPLFSGSKQRQREVKYNKKNEAIETLKFVPIKEKVLTDEELIMLRNYVKSYEFVVNEEDIKKVLNEFLGAEDLDIEGIKKYVSSLSDTNIVKELQTEIYNKFNMSLTSKQVKALMEI